METFIQETMLEDTSICDRLIEYHKNTIETSQTKLDKLDSTAPAYAMVKKNYQNRN